MVSPAYAKAAIAGIVALGGQIAVGAYLGVLVVLGMVTHSPGDGLTNSGIPFAWPIRLRCTPGCRRWLCHGQRWRRLGVLPAPLCFRSGSIVEKAIEITYLIAASGLLGLQLV